VNQQTDLPRVTLEERMKTLLIPDVICCSNVQCGGGRSAGTHGTRRERGSGEREGGQEVAHNLASYGEGLFRNQGERQNQSESRPLTNPTCSPNISA